MKRTNTVAISRASIYLARVCLLFLLPLCLSDFARAQSTAFTYHGRLHDNGVVVSGAYDLRITAYDADVDWNVVARPLDFSPVDVVNGLFTVRPDFGADVFTGPARWLFIEVRPTGGANFTPVVPRQEVTSSPYAIRAQTAGTAADVNLGSVVKSLNTLKDDVTLAAGANVTITPEGNTLTIASAVQNEAVFNARLRTHLHFLRSREQ